MIYSKTSIRLLLIILFFFSAVNIVLAQDNNNESVYNWFDKTIGNENLDINNGKLHTNYDVTLNGQNRYFISDKFTIGSLNYENQDYFKVNMKYDIYDDELILNPSNETEYIKINLIKENVNFFFIYGKKFVRIKNTKFNGYYEESQTGKNGILYVKHFKERKEILEENRVYSKYYYNNEYLLFHENRYTEITSKKDLIKKYPKNKSQINDFYDSNRNLKKENELEFMKNLLKYINNFL